MGIILRKKKKQILQLLRFLHSSAVGSSIARYYDIAVIATALPHIHVKSELYFGIYGAFTRGADINT